MKPAGAGILRRADMHIHILPGVDDGARTLTEAAAMLRCLRAQNVTHAVATPHYIPGSEWSGARYLQKARDAMRRLEETAAREAIPLALLCGFEVRASEALLFADELPDLLIGRTPYLLLEAPFADEAPWLEELLYSLQVWKIQPILAHPERCACFARRFERLQDLVLGGVQVQINLRSLTGWYGHSARRTAIRLLRQGLAAYTGSDAHTEAGCVACAPALRQVARHARGNERAVLRGNALAALTAARETDADMEETK